MATVADVLEQHRRINGNSDPRLMLDQRFWTYLAVWDRSEGRDDALYAEMEQWCDQALGERNWFRMFNKFWFRDEQCLTMFKLTRNGGPDGYQGT
jgi:hypothetical protein